MFSSRLHPSVTSSSLLSSLVKLKVSSVVPSDLCCPLTGVSFSAYLGRQRPLKLSDFVNYITSDQYRHKIFCTLNLEPTKWKFSLVLSVENSTNAVIINLLNYSLRVIKIKNSTVKAKAKKIPAPGERVFIRNYTQNEVDDSAFFKELLDGVKTRSCDRFSTGERYVKNLKFKKLK
jgi:hypothetical protein